MANQPKTFDHIYFAPHLDDVALSCGGRIALQTAAGQSVLVVTITAGSPTADQVSDMVREHHERWAISAREDAPPPDMVAARRSEDMLANRVLGAEAAHWDILDCIYRRNPDSGTFLYTETADLFGPVSGGDAWLVDELAKRMASLPAAEFVYLPLGVGNHVDHQLTRQAGEKAFGPGAWYYEEYPYVVEHGALEAVMMPADWTNWQPVVTPLNQSALEQKIAAIMAYKSQISTFFTGPDDLDRKVRAQARQTLEAAAPELLANGQVSGAERYWHRASHSFS